MKTKKVIIGLIGTAKSGRTSAAQMLQSKGFYLASINEKVAEFASHLFSQEEMQRESNRIINQVRRRGCSVNKEYWLNLVLISVPDDVQYVVFDDISIDEANNDKVQSYQIYREGVSQERMDNIDTIENDGTLEDLSSKMDKIYEEITSS